MSLAHQTGPVAAPVAARPAGALVEELGAVFQRRLDLALAVVLDPRLPLVADEPSRDKVVVVGVEDPASPLFVLEAVQEVVRLQNLRSIGARATRHARSAAVHVVRSRDLKVASLNVGGAEPIPEAIGQRGVPFTTDSLVGADATHLGVLKGSKDPRHQSRGPGDIVVGHDGDGSLDVRQSLADLEALVGNGGIEDADGRVAESSNELVEVLSLVVRGDEDELRGLAGEDALERRAQFLKHIMNGRNNNGDVLVGKGRLLGNWLGSVDPVANTVDDEAKVAMDPAVV